MADVCLADGFFLQVSEAALASMQATVRWGALVTLVVPQQPDQVVAGAGEESTEAEYQARREAVNVRIFHRAFLV